MVICGIDASTNKTGASVFIDGKYISHTLIDLHKEKNADVRIPKMMCEICDYLDWFDIDKIIMEKSILKTNVDKNKKDIRILYKKMESTFQKVGIIKYDAFNQMGGKLSFSLALLNENDDGFILNSVHSSDGCYSYTKIVKNGRCDINLGEEEKQALDMAIGIED